MVKLPEDLFAWVVAQPVALVVLALLIDRVWPRRRANPPRLVMAAVQNLVARLNRADRAADTRQSRGFVLWAATALVTLGLGGVLAAQMKLRLDPEIVFAVNLVLLASGIGYQAARSTARRAVEGVARMTGEQGELAAGRVAWTACQRLATRLSEGTVTLVLAFLLLGLPGLLLVKAGQWLVQGTADDRDGAFGRAIRVCHGLITAPASWVAGALMSPGHFPRFTLGPDPAVQAMIDALGRAGADDAMPAARVAAARGIADQAHATWVGLMVGVAALILALGW